MEEYIPNEPLTYTKVDASRSMISLMHPRNRADPYVSPPVVLAVVRACLHMAVPGLDSLRPWHHTQRNPRWAPISYVLFAYSLGARSQHPVLRICS